MSGGPLIKAFKEITVNVGQVVRQHPNDRFVLCFEVMWVENHSIAVKGKRLKTFYRICKCVVAQFPPIPFTIVLMVLYGGNVEDQLNEEFAKSP